MSEAPAKQLSYLERLAFYERAKAELREKNLSPEEIKLKINACSECNETDSIKPGQTSVGCSRCKRYTIGTDTASAIWTWNKHNKIAISH